MSHPGWWQHLVEKLNAHQQKYQATLPGAVFAVETLNDGRQIGSIGEGWSNETIFELGSATKPFTATALLLALEERDLLDIERPVYELPGMELYAGSAAKRQIKVRHLLQHTSGLPSFQHYKASAQSPCNDPEGDAPCCSDERAITGPTVPWTGSPGGTNECTHVDGKCLPARLVLLDKVGDHVMKTYSPLQQPGRKFSVNNYGFIVAGKLIEQLTGKSMNRYVKEKLFAPLGMKDSFYVAQGSGDPKADAWIVEGVTAEQRARIADLSVISEDEKLPPEIAPGPQGKWDKYKSGWRLVEAGGGMYSTAGDLLLYLAMLRDGGISEGKRILSKPLVDLLFEDQGFRHTMGFAFVNTSKQYGPDSKTLMHLGGFSTFYWFDQRAGNPLIGMFLTQRMTTATTLNDDPDVIFKVYAPLVEFGVFGDPLPEELR